MRAIPSAFTLGILLTCFAPAVPSMAQVASKVEARIIAAVNKVQDACSADIRQFCGTVTPGEGRVLLCIQAHEDKISNKCDYALFEASRALDRALDKVEITAEACWSDIEKTCAGIPPGGGTILQCLADKKSTLSQRCQRVVSKIQAKK